MTFISVPDGIDVDGIRLKARNDVIEVESLKAWSEPIRTVGNKQRGDRINADFWVQEDWTGGLGYHTHKGSATDPENTHPSIRGFYDSTLETRWEGQVTLAEKVQTTTQDSADDLFRFVEAGDKLYAFSEDAGQSIAFYDYATPNWEDALDMSSGFSNLIPHAVIEHLGDVYIFGGSSDTVAGMGAKWSAGSWASFTPSTTNLHHKARSGVSFGGIMYVATYNAADDLVRIEQSTDDGDTWAIKVGMEVTNTKGETVELVEYFDASGTPAIYLHSDAGLYLLDFASSTAKRTLKFTQRTALDQTVVNNTGRPLVWNGLLYLPRGQSLIEFHYSAAWRDVSFMTQGNVPAALKTGGAFIGALTASDQWLFIGISTTGTNSIWAYDGAGYHYIWSESSLAGDAAQTHALRDITIWKPPNSIMFTQLHIAYENTNVSKHVMKRLDHVLENPTENTAKAYETSGYMITPWFDAGMSEVDAVILATAMGFKDVDASETVKVETETDYSGSYETGTRSKTYNNSDTSGDTYKFDSGAGFSGKTWRHKYTMAGAGSTDSPIMFYPITYFEKVFTDLHSYKFEVDVKASLGLNGPAYASEQGLVKALETAHAKIPLVPFSYSGSSIHSGGAIRYVRLDNMPHVDRTGSSGESYGGAEMDEAFIQLELKERL